MDRPAELRPEEILAGIEQWLRRFKENDWIAVDDGFIARLTEVRTQLNVALGPETVRDFLSILEGLRRELVNINARLKTLEKGAPRAKRKRTAKPRLRKARAPRTASRPPKDADRTILLTFPMPAGPDYKLERWRVLAWLETYPLFGGEEEVLRRLRRCRQHLLDNPDKRTSRLPGYMNLWLRTDHQQLEEEQRKPARGAGVGASYHKPWTPPANEVE